MKTPLIETLCLLAYAAAPANAVVVATPAPLNLPSEAPDNGAPWDNVLFSNTSSSVYLGGGWVLTAEHVYDDRDPAFVKFGGVNYFRDPNFVFEIDNPPIGVMAGLSQKTDLVLFRLGETLPLPTIQLGNVTALTGITMIGFGGGDGIGGGKSWGTNIREPGSPGAVTVRDQNGVPVNNGFIAFVSDYDSATQTEAQAVGGDSGGAAFFFDGAEWRLGGIMLAVTLGGTQTFHADLAFYQSDINNIIATNGDAVPEPSAVFLTFASTCCLFLRRRR